MGLLGLAKRWMPDRAKAAVYLPTDDDVKAEPLPDDTWTGGPTEGDLKITVRLDNRSAKFTLVNSSDDLFAEGIQADWRQTAKHWKEMAQEAIRERDRARTALLVGKDSQDPTERLRWALSHSTEKRMEWQARAERFRVNAAADRERRIKAKTEVVNLMRELGQARAERDVAFTERARLLAWAASTREVADAVVAPSTQAAPLGSAEGDPTWFLYLYIDGYQWGWQIHPGDLDLFDEVRRVPADSPRAKWDGHTVAQKYQQMKDITRINHRRTY